MKKENQFNAEIIKVGNPALQPQFSNSLEIGYKNLWKQGYLYASLFLKNTQSTITRIATKTVNSNLIYSVSNNAGNNQRAGDYLAPDIIPQGKIQARFSVDFGANINFKIFII